MEQDKSRSNSDNSFKGANRHHTETFARKHHQSMEKNLNKLKDKRGRNDKLENSRSHSHNPK